MKHICRLNGEVDIVEPIILELINTPEFQRLKGIDQAGYFEQFFPNSKHSRFEHSIGCYLLLKRYGAYIAEQIAGLLHDLSHSVFSHCADYALAGGSETKHSYQDNIFKVYVLNSSIPEILEKHGFLVDHIIDENNFSLQETLLPDLCADRIDYSLRALIAHGEIDKKEAWEILNSLMALSNKWIFKDLGKARRYTELFSLVNKKYFAGIEAAVMFRTVGDYLKYALTKKYISEKDLYMTDNYVITQINKNINNDPHLQKLFDRMNNKYGYEYNENDHEAIVLCKSRVIDPLVFVRGQEPKRVSELWPAWKKELQKESKPKKYFLKFLD